MKAIGEFIVRIAELVEAEGRVAKRSVVRVIVAALVWVAAVALLVVGAVGICGAIFLGLQELFPTPWALAFTALLPLGAGVACAIAGYFLVKRERR